MKLLKSFDMKDLDEFIIWGEEQCSNPELLRMYEDYLQEKQLESIKKLL